MPPPKIGTKAPVFKGECTGKGKVSLTELKGKTVVLYFYPKDNTPGCTKEACSLRDRYSSFNEYNIKLI